MKKILILFLGIILGTLVHTQEIKSFEKQAKEIAEKLENFTKKEKADLKKKVENLETLYENNKITIEELNQKKKEASEYHANRINEESTKQEKNLHELVKQQVNGQLEHKKDSINYIYNQRRFSNQFVFAFGLNSAIASGIGEDHLKTATLGFGEIGFTWRYRILKESNLLGLKFGISYLNDEIRLKNNTIFQDNNNVTTIEESSLDIDKVSLLNYYFSIPLYLEFDFSKPAYSKKNNKKYFRSNESLRFGIGGFLGFRFATQQKINFKENNEQVRNNIYRNYNVEDVIYGPSAYIGYRDFSIYAKYNLNNLFRTSPTEINYLSIGLRFDWD